MFISSENFTHKNKFSLNMFIALKLVKVIMLIGLDGVFMKNFQPILVRIKKYIICKYMRN